MNSFEWRSTLALGAIQALRMFGMFMILPVFALYARDLPGIKGWEIGFTIGLYGLVQAALQIPFGILSDRLGRKPVIVAGLAVFAIGSIIAGSTRDIQWIMFGRMIQGAGAVSGAVSALLADTTRVQVRTQAMAIMGAGMGLSFVVALVAGPIFDGWIGVDGIFRLTGLGALLAIPLVIYAVPDAPRFGAGEPRGFGAVIADMQLLRLDGGIFLLHTMMTCLFIAAPQAIEQTLGLPAPKHWQVYLPVLVISLIPVFPLIRRIESTGHARTAFVGAIVVLATALAILGETWRDAAGMFTGLIIFFVAFNYLEGSLPSMISKRAPASRKGAALGIYSSAQFLGGAAGSNLGEFAVVHWGIGGAFAAAAALCLIWLSFATGLAPLPESGEPHDDSNTTAAFGEH